MHWLGLGVVLWQQSRRRTWTRHFVDRGRALYEAFDDWRRAYNLSLTMNVVVFLGLALRYLPEVFGYTQAGWAGVARSFVDSAILARLLGGITLIALNVWSSVSSYRALGDFAWFYGDFFIPKEYFQARCDCSIVGALRDVCAYRRWRLAVRAAAPGLHWHLPLPQQPRLRHGLRRPLRAGPDLAELAAVLHRRGLADGQSHLRLPGGDPAHGATVFGAAACATSRAGAGSATHCWMAGRVQRRLRPKGPLRSRVGDELRKMLPPALTQQEKQLAEQARSIRLKARRAAPVSLGSAR